MLALGAIFCSSAYQFSLSSLGILFHSELNWILPKFRVVNLDHWALHKCVHPVALIQLSPALHDIYSDLE